MKARLLLTSVALPLAVLMNADPANARGCGGYVNILVWGCAPWDNNPAKPGVTPGHPETPAPKAEPAPIAAAPVISNDGGSVVGNNASGSLVSTNGGNVVSQGGGNVVSQGGGNVVSQGGGNVVSQGGGNVVSQGGGNVVSQGGGNITNQNNAGLISEHGAGLIGNAGGALISEHGAGLIGNAGGALIGQDGAGLIGQDGAGLKLRGPNAYKAIDAGPSPEQLAAQKAMNDAKAAADTLKSASQAVLDQTKLINSDQLLLQKAQNDPKQQDLVGQLQAKIAADSKQLDANNKALQDAGVDFANKVTKVPAADGTAASAVADLAKNTVAAVKQNVDSAKAGTDSTKASIAAANAPGAPTAAQTAAANAVTQAQTAAAGAAKSDVAVQELTKSLGRNPTNYDDIVKVSHAENTAALNTAQSQLASAQAELAKAKASGANDRTIANQQEMVDKANSYLTYVKGMVATDFNVKQSLSDNAQTDLQNARKVVDGLTKAYGSNRPTDPKQDATMTAALAVVALAQAKYDKASADAQVALLTAKGANSGEIKAYEAVSANKDRDIQAILKNSAPTLAAAGVSGSTDPAVVAKAINTLVSTATTQASADLQKANNSVQQANIALQTAKTAPAPAVSVSANPTGSGDAVIAALSKTADALSNRVVKQAAVAPELPGSKTPANAAPGSQNPSGGSAPAATANAPASTPAADKTEISPAYAEQLLKVGPAVIQGLQAQQQAALAKGDKALADGLGKDIDQLKAQMATAKSMPATPAAAPAGQNPTGGGAPVKAADAPAGQNPTGSGTPVKTADAPAKEPAAPTPAGPAVVKPGAVANAAPATPATPAASPSGGNLNTQQVVDPKKITADQGKVIQESLKTIPGNLTKAEEKNFSALGTLADKAASKGLTPEETKTFQTGLKELADKHPKAEQQHGLAAIGNKAAEPAPTSSAPAGGSKPVVATTTKEPSVEKDVLKPQPTAGSTPGGSLASPSKPVPAQVVHVEPTGHNEVKPQPTASPLHALHAEPAKPQPAPSAAPSAPQIAAAPHSQPASPQVTPSPAPPKPALVSAAPKAPPAPVAKPQTCTPNMVNGKMMGMICH